MGIKHKLDKISMVKTEYGGRYLVRRVGFRFHQKLDRTVDFSYDQWKKQSRVTYTQAERQALYAAEKKAEHDAPRFVVTVDTVGRTAHQKKMTKASLSLQTYAPDQVIIGAFEGLSARVKDYISSCGGGNYWIIRMDAGDVLSPEFLYRCARMIEGAPDAEIVYTDHEEGRIGQKPFVVLKPDYSVDLLCTGDYIGPSFAAKYTSPDMYDMSTYELLMTAAADGKSFAHVAKCLYTQAIADSELIKNPAEEMRIEKTIDRLVTRIYSDQKEHRLKSVTSSKDIYGIRTVHLKWEDEPTVSVIIPNKDHTADLHTCLASLAQQDILDRLDIIITENNSEEDETFLYYRYITGQRNGEGLPVTLADEELKKKLAGHVRVIYYDGEFNYSAINNFAEKEAKGDFLCLLNNDVELIGKDMLSSLLSYCMLDRVGITGAKLLYNDDTVQHAGVICGFKGVAGHAFTGLAANDPGYLKLASSTRQMSAVTAACLMMKRSLFEEIGGFDEAYAVAFNDVDMCLRAGQTGAQILYLPFAQGYHYESKTRGIEDSKAKQKRFTKEVLTFMGRWREFLLNGDPFYNLNKSLQDMSPDRYREVYFADDWF